MVLDMNGRAPDALPCQGDEEQRSHWPGWLKTQILAIRTDGLGWLFRKVWILIMLPVALPFVLLIRSLRPFVLIRFGRLRPDRIGHFSMNTELALCALDREVSKQPRINLFCVWGPVCNRHLLRMWQRTIYLRWFIDPLETVNNLLPGKAPHAIPMQTDRDPDGLLMKVPAHLRFTDAEEARGARELRQMGVPEGSPFVCFDARDPAYLASIFPHMNFRYHDYRDSDIGNVIPAAKAMVERGYFAIRMGAIVREALPPTDPRIIDYATTCRSEFMDLYLAAKNVFYIGCSGFKAVPKIFRKPVLLTNNAPLMDFTFATPPDIFLPKKVWLRAERRFLTFRELIGSELGSAYHAQQYDDAGVEVIENTAEEITEAAIEMDERIRGTWETAEDDEMLQQRFKALFEPFGRKSTTLGRIGAAFLRQNSELLD